MDPLAASARLTLPILMFGTKWMTSGEGFAAAAQRGYLGLGFYVCGRCGVLGETNADVVVSSLAFFGEAGVREGWNQSPRPESLKAASATFIEQAHLLGAKRFGDGVDCATLADLIEAVCDRTDGGGLPLFAAWRAAARPSDPVARAAQAMNTFRELRGGMHLAAIRAVGLTPLEALLVRQGEDAARFFGHLGELPVVNEETDSAWEEAEQLTDRAMAASLATITADECLLLVALTETATTRPA